jgi:hypothetical protein
MKEPIERVVLKLPKSLADYFRATFQHGKRSNFVAKCLKAHMHGQEIKDMEDQLRKATHNRQ